MESELDCFDPRFEGSHSISIEIFHPFEMSLTLFSQMVDFDVDDGDEGTMVKMPWHYYHHPIYG